MATSSDFTVRKAATLARRKLEAARRALAGIPELFGDLDECLKSQAQTLVALVGKEMDKFQRDMTEAVVEGRDS